MGEKICPQKAGRIFRPLFLRRIFMPKLQPETIRPALPFRPRDVLHLRVIVCEFQTIWNISL